MATKSDNLKYLVKLPPKIIQWSIHYLYALISGGPRFQTTTELSAEAAATWKTRHSICRPVSQNRNIFIIRNLTPCLAQQQNQYKKIPDLTSGESPDRGPHLLGPSVAVTVLGQHPTSTIKWNSVTRSTCIFNQSNPKWSGCHFHHIPLKNIAATL